MSIRNTPGLLLRATLAKYIDFCDYDSTVYLTCQDGRAHFYICDRMARKGGATMSFYDRYAKCCREKGILPSSQAAAEKLGCSRSNISNFASSGITPRGDIVANAAKMLDVSADYLLGLVDNPRPIDNDIRENEQDALNLFRLLNEEGQEAAIAMLNGLAMGGIYKNNDQSGAIQEQA